MSDVVLDGTKWGKCILQSRVLKTLLKDNKFLSEQMEKVLGTMYKGETGPIRLIKGLEYVLDGNDGVRSAIDGITKDSIEAKSLLHWYAIMIYATAREKNLLFVRAKDFGGE